MALLNEFSFVSVDCEVLELKQVLSASEARTEATVYSETDAPGMDLELRPEASKVVN